MEKILHTSINTELVSASHRCEYWESYSADRLIGLTCTPYSDKGLIAKQENMVLYDLRLGFIEGNEHVIERNAKMVSKTPKESIFLSFDFSCKAFFYQGKACESLGVNDMLLYQTDNRSEKLT